MNATAAAASGNVHAHAGSANGSFRNAETWVARTSRLKSVAARSIRAIGSDYSAPSRTHEIEATADGATMIARVGASRGGMVPSTNSLVSTIGMIPNQ